MNIEDYEKFEKDIKEKYPNLFDNKRNVEISVGVGWHNIIKSLCGNIQSHIDHVQNQYDWYQSLEDKSKIKYLIKEPVRQVKIVQVKEKFGGLRFYYEGGDDVIEGMVRMAESWASNTCEVCGVVGKSRNNGWIKTLCDKHDQEQIERNKERFKN